MKNRAGKVLWVDNRVKNKFEGQILTLAGEKKYFNYSAWGGESLPNRDDLVAFTLDDKNQILIAWGV